MSDSVQPQRQEPTGSPVPDSPGKNTGVGCHFFLQCMKVKSEIEATQLCPTLSEPMGCSLPGSSIHGIFQARVLEWGAIVVSVCQSQTPSLSLTPPYPFLSKPTSLFTAFETCFSLVSVSRHASGSLLFPRLFTHHTPVFFPPALTATLFFAKT